MSQTCPYCRTEFTSEEEIYKCPSCNAPHHKDCFEENRGCTVFGCASAPADEPKVNVTNSDFQNPIPSAGGVPPAQPTPPPNPSGQAPYPPPSGMYGAPPPQANYGAAPYGVMPQVPPGYYPRKQKVVYVLLAIFLGGLGIHNFYAGYTKTAVIQLCISVLTCGLLSLVSWVWAIVEACTVEVDAKGVLFS